MTLAPYVQNPGYFSAEFGQVLFTKPGSSARRITRTDLALTCTISISDAEIFVRPEVLNLFNEQGVVAVDRTVATARNSSRLRTFNPFTEDPVRGVHYDLASTFGKPTSAADYQLPRTFRVSAGVRF